ncbi:hypothetical protein [Methylobacterium sp. DCY52]|uniref:hypothetical protein n=1 Tax=Methylobacterium sp. DCY52 TaxID=739139 RepID=UPI0031453DC4
MNDDDRDFEHSPLSGTFSRDGESVDVEIYRYADTQDPWRLVVIDLNSGGCELCGTLGDGGGQAAR